jgi:hypothetical protein
MAIALQDGVLVWQKVAKALAGANPASASAFRELKTYIVTQGQNPQLQFVPFTAEQIVTNGGYSPDVDANTIYGIYLKGRRTTGTTSSFVSLHAATDNSATTTTLDTFRFKAAGQSVAVVHPTGLACETELTVSAATAVGGATESSAADAADGFVVIGA